VSALPIFRRILTWGAMLALAVAVLGGLAGFLVDGGRGLGSGLIGALMAFVFLGVTAVSIIVAFRVTKNDVLNPLFFLIVLGGWIVKFVVFLVAAFLLRDQPWINLVVLFLTIIVSVVGSLAIDVIVIARSRLPYVSDVTLPGESNAARSSEND
jgi:hypothetical protein